MADLEAVIRAATTGGVRDPELIRRVRERADMVRQEILEKHGVLNVAADLVRESRDEE